MNTITLQGEKITPSKLVCIGRNYVDHIKELNNEIPSEPVIFLKPNSALSTNLYCHSFDEIHYEAEISFLIEHQQIKAVGFGLDLTKRKIQTRLKEKGLPWERAKAFNHSAVFSDFVLFSGELNELTLTLTINGQLKQQGGVDLMINKPLAIIDEVMNFMALSDGDILMTGTPKGVGALKEGDHFVGEIAYKDQIIISKEWIVQLTLKRK